MKTLADFYRLSGLTTGIEVWQAPTTPPEPHAPAIISWNNIDKPDPSILLSGVVLSIDGTKPGFKALATWYGVEENNAEWGFDAVKAARLIADGPVAVIEVSNQIDLDVIYFYDETDAVSYRISQLCPEAQ